MQSLRPRVATVLKVLLQLHVYIKYILHHDIIVALLAALDRDVTGARDRDCVQK